MKYTRLVLAVLVWLLCLGIVGVLGSVVGIVVGEMKGTLGFVLIFLHLSSCMAMGYITSRIVRKLIA